MLFKSNAWSHDGNLVFKTHLELNEYSLDKIVLDGNIHITLHIQMVTAQCKVTLKVVLYKKFFSFFILDVCGHNQTKKTMRFLKRKKGQQQFFCNFWEGWS